MLKPDPQSDEEPKDELAPPGNQGPSFEELMMLVFAGQMRFDDPEESETTDENTVEDEPEVEGEDQDGERA